MPALVIIVAAAVSDVLDGWVARRAPGFVPTAPHRGDWLDPFCDKVFVAAVMVGLYVQHAPPLYLIVLPMTRELLQTVAMVIYRVVPGLRGLRYNYRAHPVGKVTTVAQFLTALALLLRHPAAVPLAWTTAGLGVVTVAIYVGRARTLARAG